MVSITYHQVPSPNGNSAHFPLGFNCPQWFLMVRGYIGVNGSSWLVVLLVLIVPNGSENVMIPNGSENVMVPNGYV